MLSVFFVCAITRLEDHLVVTQSSSLLDNTCRAVEIHFLVCPYTGTALAMHMKIRVTDDE